jgi:hypothetical protein
MKAGPNPMKGSAPIDEEDGAAKSAPKKMAMLFGAESPHRIPGRASGLKSVSSQLLILFLQDHIAS